MSRLLQAKPPDGEHRRERGCGLDSEHLEGLPASAREPFYGEPCDQRRLRGHQKLPDMGGGAFVRLAGSTEDGNVSDDCGERRERKKWFGIRRRVRS